MHPLLERQLRRFGGSSADPPTDWQRFLEAVDQAYLSADEDRQLLERSMDIASEELLEANRRLTTERERIEAAFTEAPAAIAIYHGPEHVVTLANDVWKEITGRAEPEGKPLWDLFPELENHELIDLLDQVYESGEAYLGAETAVALDRQHTGEPEETVWNFVWQPLRDSDGEVTDILFHGVDITEMVRSRRETEHKAEQLARLTTELQRSNRELDQFAYVASHDLKAPLRGIMNLATWLEEDLADRLDATTREYLELLRVRVDRLESFINGLLEFSRAGRSERAKTEVRIPEILAEVLDILEVPDGLEVAVAPDLPNVQADPLRLRQVLQNLVGNALRYAEERVEIGHQPRDGFHELWVRDDGPGIDPRFQEKIWGIFQRLEARDEVEGTGIGLALVKKIVEDAGGRAWVESTPGDGATFRFLWPSESG